MALAQAWKQMSWFYYQYLLVTALYMLEPWERTVFTIEESHVKQYSPYTVPVISELTDVPETCTNSISEQTEILASIHPLLEAGTLTLHEDSMLVSVVGMALYTGYVFMPQHIMAILHYFEIVQ